MLMGSPTSNVEGGRADGGEIKQNPILFHRDPVSSEEEDSSHMKEQEGTQKPKACVRKPIPAPQIWCHPECKYPSRQHCLASPLLCHISELLCMWCWWVCSMGAHSHTETVQTCQEHNPWECTPLGTSLLKVRLLLGNTNNRDTLTTGASSAI